MPEDGGRCVRSGYNVRADTVQVFLHSPHRSHGPLDIYSSLQSLFQLNMASHIGHSSTLLQSLANVLNAVNQDFLDSQLKLNSRVVNISNSFGNMGKGVSWHGRGLQNHEENRSDKIDVQ